MRVKTIKQISLAILISVISFTLAAHNKVVVVPLGEEEALAPTSKVIFVTSDTWDGDLTTAGGGSSGKESADNLCMMAANGSNSLVQGKTFKAWLSDGRAPTFHGSGRQMTLHDLPYVNVKGDTVFPNLWNLDHKRQSFILTEGGVVEPLPSAHWTGLDEAGLPSPANCGQWRDNTGSNAGRQGFHNTQRIGEWNSEVSEDCNVVGRLFCVEQ